MSELALAGNRVTVTGAAGGLGRAFALGFAKAGARLLIADVNAQGLGETERLVAETSAEVLAKAREYLDKAKNRTVEKPFNVMGLRSLVSDVVAANQSDD